MTGLQRISKVFKCRVQAELKLKTAAAAAAAHLATFPAEAAAVMQRTAQLTLPCGKRHNVFSLFSSSKNTWWSLPDVITMTFFLYLCRFEGMRGLAAGWCHRTELHQWEQQWLWAPRPCRCSDTSWVWLKKISLKSFLSALFVFPWMWGKP